MTLLELIQRGLSLCAAQETKENLGDRLSYIGMSDLARYAECPRAAIAAKIGGKGDNLPDLLTLQRGHWFESGIGDALMALNLKFVHQLEISVDAGGIPLKAHLDFTLVWGEPIPVVRVLEIKSTVNLPEVPHESHKVQVLGQISLLNHYLNQPVFRAGRTNPYPMPFPALCKKQLGLSLPETLKAVSLEGWLVYVSMQNVRVFGPYSPDSSVMDSIAKLAASFWNDQNSCMKQPENLLNLNYAQGFHPLCGTCAANANCPKFHDGENAQQWEPALDKLDNLKEQRASVDKDIREIEEALKQVCRNSGQADWFLTGRHRFRLTPVNGRKSLDMPLLREELDCLFDNYEIADTAEDILKRCVKVGAATERLAVNPVN